MNGNPRPASRARILISTALAAATAAVLLVVAILPAEYGIDPLGTGRALGLMALSGTSDGETALGTEPPGAPAKADGARLPLADDTYTVELRPFEGVEYKYRMEQGASLIYSWKATAPVEFEFHGEPDGAPAQYFDSYVKGEDAAADGSFTAAKPGIHGWYWKNPRATRITVSLRTAGFYSKSTEYRDGEHIERAFPPR